jgi:hypothetical protein
MIPMTLSDPEINPAPGRSCAATRRFIGLHAAGPTAFQKILLMPALPFTYHGRD